MIGYLNIDITTYLLQAHKYSLSLFTNNIFPIADIQKLRRLKVLDLSNNNLYGSIEGSIIHVCENKANFIH